ncbi:MAG: hypothetical protein HOC74_29490 [Gemmatimonadetes bacterium]|nr:hypothetical protein [Gemmatimonadota bacterium]
MIVSREYGFQNWRAVHEARIGHKFLYGDASLEHLRKQAKKLLKAYQAGDRSEVERVKVHCDREEFTLNDAQFVLAREYGFGSWPKLVATLETPAGTIAMSRPQLLSIECMHDESCLRLGEAFSRHLGEQAQCDTNFLDQTTYSEFIAALARPGCLCTFAMDAMQSRSVLDIAMSLVFALLGKEADDERWLTEEEKGRMEPVFHDILAELQRAWELIVPTIFGNVQIETDPQLVRVTEPDALVVLVGLEITSVKHSGLIPVAYPLPGGIYELRQYFDRKN